MKISIDFVRSILSCSACCLFLACTSLCAQTFSPVMVDGAEVKLLIPAGHCKLTRESIFGRAFYELQERVQNGINQVLAIFVNCSELSKADSGLLRGGPKSYGIYLSPLQDGRIAHLAGNIERGSFIAEMSAAFPSLNTEAINSRANERLKGEGASLAKPIIGILDKDAYALYIGYGSTFSSKKSPAADGRVWSVVLATLINHVVVSLNLYGEPDFEAPLQKLLVLQRRNAAILVKAN